MLNDELSVALLLDYLRVAVVLSERRGDEESILRLERRGIID